jgi:hypothetical protein
LSSDVQKFVENDGISRWEEGLIRECVVNVSFILSNWEHWVYNADKKTVCVVTEYYSRSQLSEKWLGFFDLDAECGGRQLYSLAENRGQVSNRIYLAQTAWRCVLLRQQI